SPGKLRIGWTATAPNGAPVHPHMVAGVEQTVKLLESLGHELVEVEFGIAWHHYFEQLITLWTSYVAWAIDGISNALKRTPTLENLERVTWELYRHGRSL